MTTTKTTDAKGRTVISQSKGTETPKFKSTAEELAFYKAENEKLKAAAEARSGGAKPRVSYNTLKGNFTVWAPSGNGVRAVCPGVQASHLLWLAENAEMLREAVKANPSHAEDLAKWHATPEYAASKAAMAAKLKGNAEE